MTKGVAIGIDLGATTSRIGIWEENHVKLIENELGKRKTPSYVSINNEEHLVGDLALNNIEINPENTIFNIKRIMGSQFNDEDMNHWSFKIVDKNGNPYVQERPYIQINYKNEVKQLTTEEITSMILSKMKEVAEYYLNENDLDQTITDIVVTVPSYFNKNQRQAMIDAGKIVDLNVNIINESTAAALAYGFKNKIKNKENILLINFGGCSYEVLLFSIVNEEYILKAVSGDSHLGGEDITNNLVDHFIRIINEKYKKDISNDLQAKYRLRKACEDVKCKLSSIKEKCIKISNLFDGITFEEIITRDDFEKLNSNLFNRLINPLKNINNYLKLNKLDISDIILVGGSSRIPIVRNTILSYFDRNEIKKNINPDEAIVTGAVIQASILSKESQKIKSIKILDDNLEYLFNLSDINNEIRNLSEKDIIEMNKVLKNYNNDSEKENERKNSMNNLENLIIEQYKLLNSEDIDFIFECYKGKLIQNIKLFFKWYSINNDLNQNYYDRMPELYDIINPIYQMIKKTHDVEYRDTYNFCKNYLSYEEDINNIYDDFKNELKNDIYLTKKWIKNNIDANKYEYDEKIIELEKFMEPINEMINEANKSEEEKTEAKDSQVILMNNKRLLIITITIIMLIIFVILFFKIFN